MKQRKICVVCEKNKAGYGQNGNMCKKCCKELWTTIIEAFFPKKKPLTMILIDTGDKK
jgi:hypothetical protein